MHIVNIIKRTLVEADMDPLNHGDVAVEVKAEAPNYHEIPSTIDVDDPLEEPGMDNF